MQVTNGYDFFDSLSETDDCKMLVASWVFSILMLSCFRPPGLATQFEEDLGSSRFSSEIVVFT